MQKKILLLGSFTEPVSRHIYIAVTAIVHALLTEGYKEYVIMNANGRYLGQYINAEVIRLAEQQKVLLTTLCEQYVPPDIEILRLSTPLTVLHQLVKDYKRKMIVDAHPDVCLFIGGGKNTKEEFTMAHREAIPCIGVPQFGGQGKEIYEIMKKDTIITHERAIFTAYNKLSSYEESWQRNPQVIGMIVLELVKAIVADQEVSYGYNSTQSYQSGHLPLFFYSHFSNHFALH